MQLGLKWWGPSAWRALGIGLAVQVPIIPINSLSIELPALFRHFDTVPHRDLLVPMMMTMPSLGIVVLAPLFGALADRLGRRRILLSALALFGTAGLLPLFLQSIYWILAAQGVVGIAAAAIMTTANALLGDLFAPQERAKWLGLQSIVAPFIAAAVTIAAGVLGTLNWRAPFATNAVAFAALVWIWCATSGRAISTSPQPPSGGVDDSCGERFPWRRMQPVFAVTIVIALIFYVPTLNFGMIYDHLGARSSALISVLSTLGTTGSLVGGYYLRRQRRSTSFNLAALCLCFGVGLAGMGLSGNYWQGLAFGAIINVGIGLTPPTLVAWALNTLPATFRGRGMGLWMSAFFGAQFLCSPLFALLMRTHADIGSAFVEVGLASLALAVLSYLISRQGPRRTA